MQLYRVLRSIQWWRAGYPADNYRKLLKISETLPRDRLEDFRNAKLRKLIAHCYENVPYYRWIMEREKLTPSDIKEVKDLAKFPVLTKEILRNHVQQLLSKNIIKMHASWSRTGGTTGEPIGVCKDHECRAWQSMCYERGLKWGGLEVDQSRITLMGGTLGMDKKRLTTRLGNLLRRDLFIPAFELRRDTAPHYFEQIYRSKSRFVVGYASSIYRLAAIAKDMNYQISFDAVFPTAELMLPEWENTIRDVFHCAVLPYYGCGEVNSLGFHRLGDQGYVIPEEHAVIEVSLTSGSTQLYGEGRFVITDLDNYAMPIIRYINGDGGKVVESTGPMSFSKIERLDGRYNSLLLTDSGDLISGVIGTHVFRRLSSVESYQIIQYEPLNVTVKIVPLGNFNEEDENLLVNLFSKHLGSKMNIHIERVPYIPRPPSGKSIFVINHCLEDSSSYPTTPS